MTVGPCQRKIAYSLLLVRLFSVCICTSIECPKVFDKILLGFDIKRFLQAVDMAVKLARQKNGSALLVLIIWIPMCWMWS